MGPISDITGIIGQFNKIEKETDSKRVKQPHTTSDTKTAGLKSPTSQSVSVEISTSGKHLLQQEQDLLRYVETARTKDTLSTDQLTSLEKKVNEGYYSRPEVVEKIADAIAELPTFQHLGEEAVKPAGTALDAKEVARIRENIRNRRYDQDQVLETIAERILKTTGSEE